MSKNQSNKAIGSWSILRKMLISILVIFVLAVTAGGIFFYDMIYTTLFPPVLSYDRIPIDLTKANGVTTTPIQINYNRKYDHFRFSLVFELEGVKDRNSPVYPVEKRERLAAFVGQPGHGPGVSFPVRLTVNKMESGDQITYHDKVYLTEGCRAWRSNSFVRQITVLHMLPGHYLVQLENLKEVAQVPDKVTASIEVVQFGTK